MAKANNIAPIFFNSLLFLSFLLLISMAESRLLGIGFGNKVTAVCDRVHGTQSGETCFSVIQTFNLTAEFFGATNPNIDCDSIFVGQWLCIDGSAN